MPKANPASTTPVCAMDRLKAIVALPPDKPPIPDAATHPDADLLRVCGGILDLRAEEDALLRDLSDVPGRPDAGLPANIAERERVAKALRPLMAKISGIPATTPAGIYAKAAVVKHCKDAPKLAQSLAAELMANAGLRRLLWPGGAGDVA